MDRIEYKAAFAIDEAGTISGTAWPFGSPDRVGDVIEKGAFASVAAPLPMLDSHDPTKVLGAWDSVTETAEGLTVKGKLLIDDIERAREVRALVQAGAMRGLSIGFVSRKALPRQGGGRTIKNLDLLEISIVAVPAHPGAGITHSKDMAMPNENEAGTLTAVSTLSATVSERPGENDKIEAKSFALISSRLDKIEAKLNRPEVSSTSKPQTEEHKAFVSYLTSGRPEGKALTSASDTPNHILAPEQIESEFLRNLVEFSPIRSIADVRTTTSAKVILPKRTGITNAIWVGETTTRTGSEPTFAQAEISVSEIATYVDISLQLAEDSAAVLTEVTEALSEDFGQKESLAFVNGSTDLEPKGFMTEASIKTLNNGSTTAIDPDALISLIYSLPATYRQSGSWVMNGDTLAAVRKLKDGDGRYLWQASYQAGQPETILGRPVTEAVDMPGIASAAEPIIFGDFKRGYRIYDRLSLAILADPYTVRANGQIRYHARRRVGAAVVRSDAFAKLVMAA